MQQRVYCASSSSLCLRLRFAQLRLGLRVVVRDMAPADVQAEGLSGMNRLGCTHHEHHPFPFYVSGPFQPTKQKITKPAPRRARAEAS